MSNLLISVIIPSFNSEPYIERLVNSLLTQTYSNWEALIVDNNSTDNTIKLLDRYCDPRIKKFTIKNEGIIAKSRNLAISNATGSWVAFLDADDWWTPNKLEECLKYINCNKFDLIYHDLFLVENPNQNTYNKFARSRKLKSPIFEDLLINGNGILNSSVVARKEVLNDIGLLSTESNKITWEDYDCWLRISKKTDRFLYINKPLGYYWSAGGNMTNPDRDLTNAKSIYDTYIKNHYEIIPSWILFSEAKAYIKKGNLREGVSIFKKINIFKYSAIDFFKAKVKILLIYFNKY